MAPARLPRRIQPGPYGPPLDDGSGGFELRNPWDIIVSEAISAWKSMVSQRFFVRFHAF